ncbi:helix-turn-helix domain-containing protein [Cellulomonas humilata]|uniref:Excisionase family DNA binding protein n=1 Tax=Cellulomonas humilata TaxID=144055 RepID=A0ABU0EKZ1_9CELL|nr:helix-turn-helix domain-containing protein [Cellulomonas humilata]MDQ0375943.1 excisionase family DNA binding protein [Cellulomonas humilata]
MGIDYTAATPEEIAESFGISTSWVREQARRGRVPHLRFGRGKIRFLPEHVDALIQLATVPGHTEDDEPPENASTDLGALGATIRSIRAHQRRPHVQGDPQMF